MIILCHTDKSSLFFLYITLVFNNIRSVLYHMGTIMSVLPLSWHLTELKDLNKSTCLFHHRIVGGYYYFMEIHPFFISVVNAKFLLTLYLTISNIIVPPVLSAMTISTYNFFISHIFYFCHCAGIYLVHIFNSYSEHLMLSLLKVLMTLYKFMGRNNV